MTLRYSWLHQGEWKTVNVPDATEIPRIDWWTDYLVAFFERKQLPSKMETQHDSTQNGVTLGTLKSMKVLFESIQLFGIRNVVSCFFWHVTTFRFRVTFRTCGIRLVWATEDMEVSSFGDRFQFQLRSDWEVGGKTYVQAWWRGEGGHSGGHPRKWIVFLR